MRSVNALTMFLFLCYIVYYRHRVFLRSSFDVFFLLVLALPCTVHRESQAFFFVLYEMFVVVPGVVLILGSCAAV